MKILQKLFQAASNDEPAVRPANEGDRQHVAVIDYSEARAKAIAWLGDRYLLAKPINRQVALKRYA